MFQLILLNLIVAELINLYHMPESVPPPIQRWLQNCGAEVIVKPGTIELTQAGRMKTSPAQNRWMAFKAKQEFSIDPPAFSWHAVISMLPFLKIRGEDSFSRGKGRMNIKIAGIIPIVDATGIEIDEGSMQRYLAEIVWLPWAAYSPYIKWDAIDNTHALARMDYNGTSGEGIFEVNDVGDVIGFTTMRFRKEGKQQVKYPWIIKNMEHSIMGGIRIPIKSTVTWELAGGPFTWLELDVTAFKILPS